MYLTQEVIVIFFIDIFHRILKINLYFFHLRRDHLNSPSPSSVHQEPGISGPGASHQRLTCISRPSDCKPGKLLLSYSHWKVPRMCGVFEIKGPCLVFKALESPPHSRVHLAALPLSPQPQSQGAAPSPLCSLFSRPLLRPEIPHPFPSWAGILSSTTPDCPGPHFPVFPPSL